MLSERAAANYATLASTLNRQCSLPTRPHLCSAAGRQSPPHSPSKHQNNHESASSQSTKCRCPAKASSKAADPAAAPHQMLLHRFVCMMLSHSITLTIVHHRRSCCCHSCVRSQCGTISCELLAGCHPAVRCCEHIEGDELQYKRLPSKDSTNSTCSPCCTQVMAAAGCCSLRFLSSNSAASHGRHVADDIWVQRKQ